MHFYTLLCTLQDWPAGGFCAQVHKSALLCTFVHLKSVGLGHRLVLCTFKCIKMHKSALCTLCRRGRQASFVHFYTKVHF